MPEDRTFTAARSYERRWRLEPGVVTVLCAVGLPALAAVIALVRWSAWWPHSDNRQALAMVAGAVAGLIAAGALSTAVAGVRARGRVVLLLLVSVAAAGGWVVGFDALREATQQYR